MDKALPSLVHFGNLSHACVPAELQPTGPVGSALSVIPDAQQCLDKDRTTSPAQGKSIGEGLI